MSKGPRRSPDDDDLFRWFNKKDRAEGLARQEEGMERIRRNNEPWQELAIDFLNRYLPEGWRGQPEDWRRPIVERLGSPTKDKAWGPVTKEALKVHLIGRTGRRIRMKSPKSHARMTDEYERLGRPPPPNGSESKPGVKVKLDL